MIVRGCWSIGLSEHSYDEGNHDRECYDQIPVPRDAEKDFSCSGPYGEDEECEEHRRPLRECDIVPVHALRHRADPRNECHGVSSVTGPKKVSEEGYADVRTWDSQRGDRVAKETSPHIHGKRF